MFLSSAEPSVMDSPLDASIPQYKVLSTLEMVTAFGKNNWEWGSAHPQRESWRQSKLVVLLQDSGQSDQDAWSSKPDNLHPRGKTLDRVSLNHAELSPTETESLGHLY